jgi:hypothetical protein
VSVLLQIVLEDIMPTTNKVCNFPFNEASSREWGPTFGTSSLVVVFSIMRTSSLAVYSVLLYAKFLVSSGV